MFGKWHLGGNLPTKNGYINYRVKVGEEKIYPDVNISGVLSDVKYDWSQPLQDGPQDIGFDHSYITPAGIQKPPYAFYRNGYLDTELSDVVFWEEGEYNMPRGTSIILSKKGNGGAAGEGSKDWDSTAYNQILVNETVAFLDDHMKIHGPHEPFFVYVALGGVHAPHSPPDEYYAKGEPPKPVAGEYPNNHLSLLHEMDMVVGSLVNAIEKRKEIVDDTVIVFTSDNGGLGKVWTNSSEYNHMTNGPLLRGTKGAIYEGGHRIPMIMRYDKRMPANETRSHLVGLNDIYATFLDMARIKKPRWSAQDSVSFANYAEKGEDKGLREYLAVFKIKLGSYDGNLFSLRKGNLKLIQKFNNPDPIELYDLDKDLSETTNIAALPEYQKVIKQMMWKLNKLGPCPNDTKGKFKLWSDKIKRKYVTCEWFSKKLARCDRHPVGEIHCNSICGRHYKYLDICS